MTFRLRFAVILIFLATFNLSAQDDIPLLSPDSAQIVTLTGEIAPTLLRFAGERGQTVIITARDVSDGDAVDVVLEVLMPDGHRLRFNDDHMGGDAALAQTDSRIKARLPQTGDYEVRVNSYGGIFEGEVEVLLRIVDLFAVEIIRDEDAITVFTLTLPRHIAYQREVMLDAGDVVTITARDVSGTLDPLLRLLDADGEIIAHNDDHDTAATALDVFDAQITTFTVDTSGTVVLEVLDFLGRSGQIELTIMSN